MRRIWDALAGLPAVARWGVVATGGLLVLLLIGSGVWAFVQHRARAAEHSLVSVSAVYRQAIPSGQKSSLDTAAERLKQFLREYPRSRAATEAWYLLGNVEYERRDFDAALKAFAEAARRDAKTIGTLSRLGQGYAWEAKGDLPRALGVYRDALAGRDPGDFSYGDLLVAMGRIQEQLGQAPAAIESYKRFLRDLPASPRVEEVKTRLAILGAG